MNRRDALGLLALATGLGGLSPKGLGVDVSATALKPVPLPDPEANDYWARLRREQFLLGPSRIFLNNGSVGVTPRPVLQAVVEGLETAAAYATDDVYRWGYETLETERTALASFLGCDLAELAITHNCTEAMSFIANGLDLKAGDEVLITNQEHPGGHSCWRLHAARYGTVLREMEIPLTPKDPSEITSRLIDAINPKTRVLSFSGIATHTGLILPMREICAAARAKGVITVIDAAHVAGQMPFHLHDIGCDYAAGSPHKWMFAPAGCGFLYGRSGALDELWSTVANAGWERRKGAGGARLMSVGTNNRAIVAGMAAGLKFIRDIGPERIQRRTRELADRVLRHVEGRSYLELVTPRDPRFYHAMVSFHVRGKGVDKALAELKARNVNMIGGARPRISCHIHTRPEDLDTLFDILDGTAGKAA